MDDLRSFWIAVAEELAARCGTDSAALDIKTIESRWRSEGDSFFTITLPAYCKDFERSLEYGAVTQELFRGWRKISSANGPSVIPQFLGGFMSLIFDRDSGKLLPEQEIEAIRAIRQLTLMYGKILLPCSDARREAAFLSYVEVEQEMRREDAMRSSVLLEKLNQASTVMWGTVLQHVDEDVYNGRIIPKHGPGKTADRLQGNRKFDQLEWTERLQDVFSWDEFMIPSHRYSQEYLPKVQFLDPEHERPVKVVGVPKTLKTPRIIAIEPTCMQYVQQGLMARFVEYIESPVLYKDPCPSWGTVRDRNIGFGVVGFRDQEPNQLLAKEGSLTGELATLDLSEASDRVSNQLVTTMLANYPHLKRAVAACRSLKADVPGHGVMPLAKFASMGSALTFPIEAMIFSSIIFIGIAEELGLPRVDTDLVLRYRSRVRVYGDDIVVPVRFVSRVVESLEAFGFKVNASKSFWNGSFRESCGKEYYNGEDVSVFRIRRVFPSPARTRKAEEHENAKHRPDPSGSSTARLHGDFVSSGRVSRQPGGRVPPGHLRDAESTTVEQDRGDVGDVRVGRHGHPGRGLADEPSQPRFPSGDRGRGGKSVSRRSDDWRLGQAQELISLVSVRNQAYLLGYHDTVRRLDQQLTKVLTHFPLVARTSAALGRWNFEDLYEVDKVHSRLHAPMVKAWAVRPVTPRSSVSGVGALLKCLLLKEGRSDMALEEWWLDAILSQDEEHLIRAGRDQTVNIKSGWFSPF